MKLIYQKELLELFRDRKTLIFTILLPTLIVPVLIGGFAYFSAKMVQKSASEVLRYAVIGEQYAPELVAKFAEAEGFSRVDDVDEGSVEAVIRNDEVRFVLALQGDARESIRKGEKIAIKLYYNSASSTVKILTSRVSKVIDEYAREIQRQLLAEKGLSESELELLTEPVSVEKVSIAKNRERVGELAGGMLAYFLLIITLTGAMYPALDLGVGEKERGTLETLLLNPVPRWQLAVAKFLVIFTTGFLAVFLALVSFALWAVIIGQAMAVEKIQEFVSMVGLSDIVVLLLMLVPTAAIFAAVLLSISLYARNFKEAQNYMSPLMMLVIIPVMMALVPGMKLNWTTAMVPLTNIALSMKEIIKGTMDYSLIAVIFGSTTVLAAGALAFCVYWFNREDVLFRS
jgi:sodium transport system permease protein